MEQRPIIIQSLSLIHIYRTDYDLTQHQNVSGQDLTYFDDEKKQKYIPYVIEPSLGADRVVLAFLCSAYDEEVLDAEKNDVRTVLHFHPALAPVKIGVLPLSKKLNEGAEKIYQQLSKKALRRNHSGSWIICRSPYESFPR